MEKSKMNQKHLKLIILIVLLVFFSTFIFIHAFNDNKLEKEIKDINLKNVDRLYVLAKDQKLICNDRELIQQFETIIHTIMLSNKNFSKMQREQRNVFLFTFEKEKKAYSIEISYPDRSDYLYLYIKCDKKYANFCYDLNQENFEQLKFFLDNVITISHRYI